ncbi:MAG TPA: glycerol-3-phosphate responsive antiterminator [Candidatus Gallacutalibacter pullistercoris]|nr:glycerol-3-phosphate responsive antiterminator [Candidatus Gallacutalibacter pullistercoris]
MTRTEQNREFRRLLDDSPVIAAVKDDAGLRRCLQSECQVVFILYGTLCDIGEIVAQIHAAGKRAVVHLDLVDGMSPRESSVDFIRSNTEADGIISTRPNVIRYARQNGLLAIQRFFIIDSRALENTFRQLDTAPPDIVEILPGVMPRIIETICSKSRVPVIASGLVLDKKDITSALQAGAIGVSSTCPDTWFM